MITQIMSMFFIYFHSLSTKNSKETTLNRSVSDFLDDNDIFTDEQSPFTMRSPIEKTINCQNLLGAISKISAIFFQMIYRHGHLTIAVVILKTLMCLMEMISFQEEKLARMKL